MAAPFNVTQAVIDALDICEPVSIPLNQLTLIVNAACAPINAMSYFEVFCSTYEQLAPIVNNTCEHFVDNTYNYYPDYICWYGCAEIATLAPRGLPNEEVAVAGSASTLHPFNFTITLASLLVVAFMFFKRSH